MTPSGWREEELTSSQGGPFPHWGGPGRKGFVVVVVIFVVCLFDFLLEACWGLPRTLGAPGRCSVTQSVPGVSFVILLILSHPCSLLSSLFQHPAELFFLVR